MRKVIVELEEFPYWEENQQDLKRQFGLPTSQEKIYSDIKKTYDKYMWEYATKDVIIATDKVEPQVYKVAAEEIQIVTPNKATETLNNKLITEVRTNKVTGHTEIGFYNNEGMHMGITIPSIDAEEAGLKEKTKKQIPEIKKPQFHRNFKAYRLPQRKNRIIKILIPLTIAIYCYQLESLIGLFLSVGAVIFFILEMAYNDRG